MLTSLFRFMPKGLRQRLFLTHALATRAMTLGVRALIRDEAGRVFLIRHTYVGGWHLPGGGVERGETLGDALHKEVEEEARLQLTGEPRLFAIYRNPLTSRFDHVALYVCDEWCGIPREHGDAEIAEAGFFALNALPVETTEPTRTRLAEVMGECQIREIW